MSGLRLCAIAALAIPACAAPWTLVRSSHFEVWTDAPAGSARELDSGLERLRTFFIQQTGIAPSGSVRVICFASESDYDAIRLVPGADGFSLAGPRGDFIVV